MQTKNIHWPSVLILAVLGTSAAFVFLIALGLGINSIYGLFTNGADPAGGMISSFAFGLMFIILVICLWFILQKALGRAEHYLPSAHAPGDPPEMAEAPQASSKNIARAILHGAKAHIEGDLPRAIA